MDIVKKYSKVILNIIVPVFWIWLVCWVGPKLLRFFMPFVIGWLIAMMANPLVRVLERRVRLVRKHSSVLIVVSALAMVFIFLYFAISGLAVQAIGFAKELPAIYNMALREIEQSSFRFERYLQLLPVNFQEEWITFTNNVGDYLNLLVQKIASPTVEAAGHVAMGIPNALIYVIITVLSAYFFIAEREQIMAFGRKYSPIPLGKYSSYLKQDIKHLISGYFLAQFKIMAVVGVMLWIGFFVLGIRFSLLLAILIAFLDFLPFFGTGTALIPWALLQVLAGNYPLAAGLAFLYILTQVVRQLIQPKLVGDTLGLPPLMTLLFLYLGFKLGGLSGMILAVPLGMFVMNLYKYGLFDTLLQNVAVLFHDIEEFRRQ